MLLLVALLSLQGTISNVEIVSRHNHSMVRLQVDSRTVVLGSAEAVYASGLKPREGDHICLEGEWKGHQFVTKTATIDGTTFRKKHA